MISLKNVLLYANEKMLTDLFLIPNDLKSMFFLRFNLTARNMNYLEGISVSQLMRINVKHINKIVQLFPRTEQDEISDIYAKAIKLYLVFGLSNTTILLNSNYPINKLFMDNVSKLDVSKVNLKVEGKKYIPVYHEDFNRFLFVANNVDALFDDETALSSGWYYLYNNFETIKDLCKGHVTLSQAETILKEQVNTVRYDLEPDCYRLEKLLYEAGLGNKTRNSNEEIYDEMCKIHRQQVKRVISTIPYVSGTLDSGWSYEVMRHDDAVAFVLGYRADCCIRTKDIAHNHLLHALLCENGRILLTYKPDGTIASFSPLKRNGEVIIANSIEAIDKSESVKFDMIEAFSMGMKEICKQTKLNEEKGYLKVATIGTNSVRKPEGTSWPLKIPTPTIYEKKDPVYCDTDTYHKSQTIFYMDEKVNLEGLKYGKSNAKYYDPRGKISSCLSNSDDILLLFKMEKKINGIRYTKWVLEENDKKYFRKTVLRHSIASFCNDDWYIILNYGGEIEYDCLDDDPRARLEMECVLKIVRQYINKNEDIKKLVLDYNEKRLND